MENRLSKRQYRQAFEKAVQAFEDSEYYLARAEFVKILEDNLKDGAARVYFHQSDKHLREERQDAIALKL